MEKVDIICPLYNASKYIENLQKSIIKQKDVNINKIHYVITKGKDNTEELVKNIKNEKVEYKLIEPKEFSHSLTREKEAYESDADIIVFISQDVKIVRDDWLYNLVKPIIDNEADECYSRQLCDNKSIEKYTREHNYPSTSRTVTKEDIKELGLNTFFSSDASSAIRRETFVKLKGYDGKKLPTSEDMYITYKLIMNGNRVRYCADSEVIHSHDYSSKDQYKKYILIGMFFEQNKYLNQYNANKSGMSMARYILKGAIKDRNIKVIFEFLPNMIARYLGMKVGKKRERNRSANVNI